LAQHSVTNTIGRPFIELESVDSTNKYAMALVHEARLPDRQGLIKHGMAFFAHEQTAGKGQRGKEWITEKSANIILSVLLQPAGFTINDQFKLSACIAVAVHQFFSKYAGDHTISTKTIEEGASKSTIKANAKNSAKDFKTTIKWPNDIYWQDRKAAGILIENVIGSGTEAQNPNSSSNWQWAVAGIGININQTVFVSQLHNPVSLKQITGKNFDPVKLAKELCTILNEKYNELLKNDFEKIFNYYLQHLYKKDKKVKFKKDTRVFEAVVKGVTKTGKLIIRHSIEEEFDFGELEWVV
jgi:BirA family transcriptional regulator, biotin operon repressor / biotin---[acetyl-CoA-carboxylase] ligase